MCGIIGYTGFSQAAPILLDGLEKLEYRGYDSAGIALLDNGVLSVEKTTERIAELKAQTKYGKGVFGNIGIGHTRWATHGAPCFENAHPHLSYDRKFAIVHNGIIENFASIRKELEDEGIEFLSETDSEVVANLIAKNYTGDFLNAVGSAVSRLKGSYSLGILCCDEPQTLIAVKNFSPLIIGVGKGENFIASDTVAIIRHTDTAVYLEDGEIAVLRPTNAEFYGSDGRLIKKEYIHLSSDTSDTNKGNFEHFMMKEIYEQPSAVWKTAQAYIKDNRAFFQDIPFDKDKLKSFNQIKIIGCGSAYHAGMVGKYVIEELVRIPVEVDLASEFRYRNPLVNKRTLIIAISQSGETADTLAALKEAKRRGAYILSVVNVEESSIAKSSDFVFYTKAGPEIAVATTKGYSTQLVVLYLFAVWAADILNTADKDELSLITDGIIKLPNVITDCIEQKDKIRDMAKRSCYIESIFFIGRNIDYAVSIEASLKLKEISYIHSEAYAAGELKHGTISLIEHGTTVIALSCYDRLRDKLISNIKEVKARGAFVIACANEGDTTIEKEVDEIIYLPKTHPLLHASAEVVPFQLYAYYVSVFKDLDVDKPRNLAKSVTVE